MLSVLSLLSSQHAIKWFCGQFDVVLVEACVSAVSAVSWRSTAWCSGFFI